MALLFSDDTYRSQTIYTALQAAMAAVDFRLFPAIGNPEDIHYAVIWYPKADSLQNLPNLRAIFSIAAGVDGILKDTSLPPHIPIVRSVDPGLTGGMVEHVLYHVLKYHRHYQLYEAQQPQKLWKQHPQIAAYNRTVGIMGLGQMGAACADALSRLGFHVKGWSRTAKNLSGIKCFCGPDQFAAFLSGTEILVNVLPLTTETTGILCRETFEHLPAGAFLINAGRGRHMVPEDVLAALHSGQLAAAALDVFATEPLPADSPFWTHPAITLTPHIASITDFAAVARNIQNHIAAFENGQALPHVVDRARGY